MIHLALFGRPVRHSLSPRIHSDFGKQSFLGARYDAIDTGPGELADALREFAAAGGSGCNITLPLKHEAMALASRCSGAVERAGAANTLSLDGQGGWDADNTDGVGLRRDLQRVPELKLRGKDIAIVGAGGAVAGVLGELLATDPAKIRIFNRTAQRAEALADSHAELGPVEGGGLAALAGAGPFSLLINATSLGHAGAVPELNEDLFAPGGICYDLNYGRAAEPLAQWAREHRIRYRDGLGMLVEQAAESFRLWTGFVPNAAMTLERLRREGLDSA